MPIPKVIHAYHVPVVEIDQRETQAQIEAWRASWTRHGWQPQLLNTSHAAIHPRFRKLTAELMRRPTVNFASYEVACFHRWVAMANFGGWMCDYDVVNRGFTPEHAAEHEGGLVLCDTPCLVYGSKPDYERVLSFFEGDKELDVERGEAHYSDQSGVRHFLRDTGMVEVKLHVDYPEMLNVEGHRDWLVHVKNDHAREAGRAKSEIMREVAGL